MPPISKDQQDYCKLGQLFHYLYCRNDKALTSYVLQIENVNFKILNNKTNKWADDYLIGATILHVTCNEKNIDAFDILLKRGADFTATNKNGYTALHRAFHVTIQGYPPYDEDERKGGILDNLLIKSVLKAHVESANSENPRSSDGLSHFHIACAANHLEGALLFLNSGLSVNEAVNNGSKIFAGYTPLHFAVRFCGYETAKLLLERGADINAKTAKGLTPLHLVIAQNLKLIQLRSKNDNELEKTETNLLENILKYMEINKKTIELFLEDDRLLKVDETGFSKFHAICTLSNTSLVERFLQDVDINCTVNMDCLIYPGYTALHFAAHFSIEIVKLLLKNGFDIAAEEATGVTPFDICLELHGLENLYDILLAIPAFGDILFSDNVTKLSDFVVATQAHSSLEVFLQSIPKDVYLPMNSRLWPGYRLSHLTVLFSKSDSYNRIDSKDLDFCPTETYLNCSGKVVISDAHGRTPLHLAFYQQKDQFIDQFFKYQLGLVDLIDNDGLSHLHIACHRTNESVVRTLLSTGADVNNIYKGKKLILRLTNNVFKRKRSTLKLMSGSTPLHIAMHNRNFDIIKVLLEYGADANLTDADGMTPMHRFTHLPSYFMRDDRKAIKEVGDLLFSSCELKNVVCNDTGISHLHVACYTANADAVERLLKLGANPNALFLCKKDQELSDCNESCTSGYTPMHFAVGNNDMKIVELLLQGGADVHCKRPSGTTLYYDMISHHKGVAFCVINMAIAKYLTTMLTNDASLRQQVEEDTGLTLLHIACFLRDTDQIKNLLIDLRVDVNARVHANSPIWPKATALHILCGCGTGIQGFKQQLKLLLDRGADVTLMNSAGDTPLMICYALCIGSVPNYNLLRLLLSYQTDFSVNPVNEEGISHFHMSCMIGEYTIVEKFLRNGVDVNLPIDYRSREMTFQTPLQFMLRFRNLRTIDDESCIKTIDALLEYGADVNAQDENGSTPFLEVASTSASRKLLFQKLVEAGADMNCTDIYGRSALEILFDTSDDFTFEELQIFLDNRIPFNAFNVSTGIGIISMIINHESTLQTRKLILEAIMENPNLFAVDNIGRTPIHNLVANHSSAILTAEYANYIDKFIEMGYDINSQDSEGKTALHLTSSFLNGKAICGLLISGADINITDMSNRLPFAEIYTFRNRWGESVSMEDNRCSKTIIAMQLCGLEINSKNLTWANSDQLFESHVQLYQETILKELEDAKLVKIGTGSLTLRDFLSETGAVASGPSMICPDREAVDKFFESVDYKRFPELSYLFMLQYRKMLKRLPLMEEATDSLREILGCVNGFSIPEICCRMIIRFLTNTEVKHLIASASLN